MVFFFFSSSDDNNELIGILKLRYRSGMAVRPDRSASRLLAAAHISSLSASDDIQAKGLDTMRVRYDGIPSSLIEGVGFLVSLAWSSSMAQEGGPTARRFRTERSDWDEGLVWSWGRSRAGTMVLGSVSVQVNDELIDGLAWDRGRVVCFAYHVVGLRLH